MAINYPAACRGVTAGTLRQLKQQGYAESTNLYAVGYVRNRSLSLSDFKSKTEPLGQLMNELEQTEKQLGDLGAAMRTGMRSLVAEAREQTKAIADVSGKLRDGAEKLGAAVEKFSKVAGNANFAETVKQAESLVNSLERLAALQQSGMLDKVIAAMTAQRPV